VPPKNKRGRLPLRKRRIGGSYLRAFFVPFQAFVSEKNPPLDHSCEIKSPLPDQLPPFFLRCILIKEGERRPPVAFLYLSTDLFRRKGASPPQEEGSPPIYARYNYVSVGNPPLFDMFFPHPLTSLVRYKSGIKALSPSPFPFPAPGFLPTSLIDPHGRLPYDREGFFFSRPTHFDSFSQGI